MAFDADKYLASLKAPEMILEGTTYTGKILSFNDTLRFAKRFEQLAEDGSDVDSVIREFCDALELPTEKILALPLPVQIAAVNDFFQSLSQTPVMK